MNRHVLSALARGIAADDDLAAHDALGSIDPFARGFARRRLATVLLDAELATTTAGLARPPRAHIMRLAALAVAKREPPAADDVAAVTTAYAALPAPRAPKFPLVTVTTLTLLLALGGGTAFAITQHLKKPKRTYERPVAVETAAAFKTGGVPVHDPALEQHLQRELTDLVIDTNRHRAKAKGELAALRTVALGHGTALDQSWQHALDAFAAAPETIDEQLLNPRATDTLRESVRELTDQFAAAGLGYFLEGRIKDGVPLVQAYRIEEVVFVTTAGKPRRVLSLRRLDKLNTAYAALGLFDEDVGDPTLHLERIDEYVATTELPVVATGASYALAEERWLAEPVAKELAAAVGDAVRKEYVAALGADAEAAAQIAKLLAERAGIIDTWRQRLDKKDIVFSSVDNMFVPEELMTALDGLVPHYQHERVEAIDDELASLEAPRIHARVHDLVAATVRRHEAQHGFDFDRDTELRYPPELQELTGSPHDEDGNPRAIVTSARAELAGYLSQVINDPTTPHASLWHLASQVFTDARAGTGEFYAGIVVLEGLAKQLGADTSSYRWRRGGGLERERMAKLALVIAKTPGPKLRDAAKAVWQQLFGEPPTPIVDSKTI